MDEIGLSYIPDNYYDSNEDQKENNEEEKEQKEAQEQKDLIIQNVSNVINKITSLASTEEEQEIEEEKEQEFVPGIIRDQTKLFNEYRTNFQNRFFHYLEKDIFDDTKKLLSNSFLFIEKAENKNTKLLNYDQIELHDITYNLDNSNYVESYKKVNNILDELLTNFASLKSFQQERIKPKFIDEDIQNKKIDAEIDKLIIKMMKKIKFCEALTKMIKEKKNEANTSLEKVKNNIKIFLTTKIQNFSNEFRQNQQQYLKYLKDMGIIIYSNEDKNNKSESLLNGNDDEKKNFLYTKDDDVNIHIKKRDEDIDTLVKSINELSGIFKDLQNIVQEQGTILDRIDYNINISYENSQEGLQSLKKAEEHNKESCFRNAILLLFVIIFVETILIICKLL